MSTHQFLLDENVDPTLQKALHQRAPGMVVWVVGAPGAPELGTLDAYILMWCEGNNFSLITNNRSSMPVHLAEHLESGRRVPGIFILNANLGLNQTVNELALLWGASQREEYMDRINFLPLQY